MLDDDGLAQILKAHGYPHVPLQTEAVGEELMRYSKAIRSLMA